MLRKENQQKPKHKPRTKNCAYCGRIFILPHGRGGNAKKYCSEACTKNARREKNLLAVRRYQKKYYDLLKNKPSFNKYAGRLGVKPSSNFDEEYRKIKAELKRFGLKGIK